MLQVHKSIGDEGRDSGDPMDGLSLAATLTSIIGIVRRRLWLLVAVTTCTILLGIFYLITTPPLYVATATMVIDTRKVQLFQQQSVLGDAPIDAGTVQTEVEILKSDNVSQAVIRSLNLTEDGEFVSRGGGVLGALLQSAISLVSPQTLQSEAVMQRRALAGFGRREAGSRVGLTYVMNIGFQSQDPDKAARIANAIADAYITDQLEAKYQATRRASVWLQDRLGELGSQASAADRAAVDFKQKNNINTVDATGRLMGEQQMSEVNTQLIQARAATAEAKARLDRIDDIMKDPIPDASVADALKSEVIVKLRGQYLELAGKEAIWAQRYGATHEATLGLLNQMSELRRNISDEMRKIAQSYRSDYEIAQSRENDLKQSLETSVSESNVTNQAQIKLRELQSTAQSYRAMYDNFLKRYMETIQQESFPITEARLISPATRPIGPNQPKVPLVLAIAVLSGLALGFVLAFLREFADHVFRSSRQVQDTLQLNCLAMLPGVKVIKADTGTGSVVDAAAKTLSIVPSIWRYALDEPFSQFSEALRNVKVAVDLANAAKTNKVLGVTSSLPTEGKSTTSTNFAQLIAHAGNRVLLIDADLRNPSLSRALASGAETGLVDLISGTKHLHEVIWTDPDSGLFFVPAGGSGKLLHTSEMLGSDKSRQWFEAIREQYDYVIVDLAPLAPVVDTRTTTGFIDSYVYVIEWGKTKIDVVEHSLNDAREIYDKILGVVLNKTDLAILGRYERHRSKYYYRKYYQRYGYTS